VLIDGIDLSQYSKVYIPITCIEELDNLKCNKDYELAHKAKQAIKQLEKADNIEIRWRSQWSIPMEMPNTNDNQILAFAKDCVTFDKECVFLTNDYNVRLKAKHLNINCEPYNQKVDNEELYLGYKEVILSEYEQALFYECQTNKWDLIPNQYLLIRDEDNNLIDRLKWTEKGFKHLTKKSLKSIVLGDLKPKDEYQELCMDSLITDQFTIITGKAGSGKSLLSLMYCMWAIQTQKYDRVIIMYNPTKVRGAVEMGYYSGNALEKGLQQFIGNMLNTKFGDRSVVNTLLNQDKIQLVSMADCRGMEVLDNQILYIPEAQNTSPDLMKICLSRVSKDAKCIIEGDHLNQIDLKNFDNKNNGLSRIIDVFKGRDFVSYVHLKNVWRSKIAEIADEL